MRYVVVLRSKQNVIRNQTWDAADRPLKRQLSPEIHVAEDTVFGLRLQRQEVPYARHTSAPGELPGAGVVGRHEGQSRLDWRADQGRHPVVLIVHRAPRVHKGEFRVPIEQRQYLGGEFRLDKVIVR